MRSVSVAILIGLLLGVSMFVATSASGSRHASPQFREGQFHNADPMIKQRATDMARIMWDFMFNAPAGTVPAGAIPVRAMTRSALLAAPDNTLYRLGHSSTLLKLGGEFYLLDPVFSKRASRVQWAGPARFHETPISIEELPPLKAVFISHDHYDHLDHATIMALAPKTSYFLTPLGVGARYGPFDVAIIENGAYDKQWPDVHMQPEETLQAFADVKGAWLLPVHNGTFDLGLHRWQAPFERIAALAQQQGVSVTTPQMGEAVDLEQPHAGQPWWRGLK